MTAKQINAYHFKKAELDGTAKKKSNLRKLNLQKPTCVLPHAEKAAIVKADVEAYLSGGGIIEVIHSEESSKPSRKAWASDGKQG